MEDVVDPHAALDEVAHQRNELADRIRVPAWYVAADVVALIVLFCFPRLGNRALSSDHGILLVWPIWCLSVMVFTQWPLVVRYVTGAQLPTKVRRAYPSMRRPFVITASIYALGIAVGTFTATWSPWAIWVGCGVTLAVLTVIGQMRMLAAIRHDIRTGQVAGA